MRRAAKGCGRHPVQLDEDVDNLSLSLHHSLRASAKQHQTQSRGEIADEVSSSSSASASSLTLRDLLNMDRVRSSVAEFEKYAGSVESKLGDVRALITRVDEEGDEMMASVSDVNDAEVSGASGDELGEVERSASEILEAQQKAVEKLDGDVDSVTSRVTEVMAGIMSSSASSVGSVGSVGSASGEGGGGRRRASSSAALMRSHRGAGRYSQRAKRGNCAWHDRARRNAANAHVAMR